jgi:putative hydrolase of the HAD superfamily
MAIRAVMFDFGGVISTSPFEEFARLEIEHGLPPDFIRTVNATNPHDNAWARLERAELGVDAFGLEWAAEARALGYEVDGRRVLAGIGGKIRPQMVVSEEVAAVYALFDAVLESRVLGVRKPDPRFYELACTVLGVEPEESVFLDDLGVNLKPARALGMHTIKVADPDQALAELERVLEHPIVVR